MNKLFFSLVFSLFSFSISFADNLGITQYPLNPREDEDVKLTLSSTKYNLNIANVSWVVDGVEKDAGVGRTTFSTTAKKGGLSSNIKVTVSQDGYDDSTAQISIVANTNYILYEGVDSYVPSFYKGRAMPPREGIVRAAYFSFKDGLVNNFNNEGSSNFTWKVNGEEKKEISGINKIVNQLLTKVTDTALNLSILKEDSSSKQNLNQITIPLQRTEVVIYKSDEKHLTLQPVGDVEIGKSLYMSVEPFFFSVSNKRDSSLIYTWKMNDVAAKIDKPWSVLISGKNDDTVKINLDIINNNKITQDASTGLTFKVQ